MKSKDNLIGANSEKGSSSLNKTEEDSSSLNKTAVGFMTEDNGKYSSMRLMSLIALISAIAFGVVTIANPDSEGVGTNLTYSFLVAAFTPKAVQKFAEQKIK